MSNPVEEVFKFDIQYQEGATVNWRFDFDSLEELHYTNTSCYCTQLKESGTNHIAGVLNIDSAMSNELKAQKGNHDVDKVIYVYLDKDVPEMIPGHLNLRIPNPEKRMIKLTLRGIVRVG